MILWVAPTHFYKAGKLIVLYVGCDSDVIDVLQETMGPQFAGGAGVGVHGVSVAGHGRCPEGVQPVPASMGMPVASFSGPLLLTFDGVEYAAVEWLGAASPDGPIVCCGTPINMDDMEVVGTGTRNTDGGASVEVYRPKAGATTDVYTFHPAQTVELSREGAAYWDSHSIPEAKDGTDTGPATWFRWIAK